MRSLRFWPLFMVLFSCHSEESQLDSINENLRNNGNIALIRNEIPTADRLPNLPVNPAYFVLMKDVKDDGTTGLLAYPVNCEDSEADNVLAAFGLSKTTADKTGFGLNDLKTRYEADKQPVLNCSAIHANAKQRQVSAVFRLQNKDGQTAQNPSYYLKFDNFPNQIFQVGCLDILNSFAAGSDEVVNFAQKAIPLPDARALPYLDQNAAIDMSTAVPSDTGIRRLSCRASGTPLPQPAPLAVQTAETEYGTESKLLYVEAADSSSYVYTWKGGSRRVECPGAPEEDLLRAFNFPPTETAEEVQLIDPRVLAADELEPLRCVNPLFPPTLSIGFRTVDSLPEQHAFKSARESSELFTFGCASAEDFFVGSTISREAMIPVSSQTLDFLLSHPNLSEPTLYVDRVHVPCVTAPYSPYRDPMKKAYLEVSGGQTIEPSDLDQLVQECFAQPQLCKDDAYLKQRSVDFLKKSEVASSEVVIRAFKTTLTRSPFPEELNFFLRKFKLNDSVRPHYGELLEYVKKIKILDRALFTTSLRYAFGTDYQGPLLDDWTTKAINNPTLAITADSLKKEHEAYILKSYTDAVIRRVYDINFKTTMADYQLTRIRALILTDKTLKPLYQDIVQMLNTVKECRNLDPKVENASFTLLRPRTKVKFVKGTWSAIAGGTEKSGPAGHAGYGDNMTLPGTNLGRLLIRTQKAAVWGPWVGWTDNIAFEPFIGVGAIINDTKGLYGDNTGSLEICFE